jgi:hypothetical protein
VAVSGDRADIFGVQAIGWREAIFMIEVSDHEGGDMPWVYKQSDGKIMRGGADGPLVGKGYSGKGSGKDNPSAQASPSFGPIPRGTYRVGSPFQHPHAGAYALRLTPIDGTYTFGRSGFLIHGDSRANPGDASDGCVVLPLTVRQQIWNSGDHILEVVQ